MVRILLEGLSYLAEHFDLLFSLLVLTGIVILLSKSMKKHAKYYYYGFGLLFLLIVVQFLNRIFEVTSLNLFQVPVLGKILVANIHMAEFGFPLLIIIMYVGALDTRIPGVAKILSVRKELSIISGFPVLSHSLVRVTYNFVDSVKYFMDKVANVPVGQAATGDLGKTLANSGYLLGILMLILFLVLWITSFDSVHKKMGFRKWKKVQNWAYLLYFLLFAHSLLLHAGWMLSRGSSPEGNDFMSKQYIAVASTVLIFGSYLFLRLKKARADVAKRRAA